MTPTHARTFNAETLLPLPALAGPVVDYQPAVRIYAQGEAADTILYIQQGCVKLSVLTPTGKEALVGMLGGGEFFGEGPLAGQRVRLATATATAVTVSTIRVIPERDMNRLLHEQPAVSDRFIAHLLARTTRLEADLVDHLFSGCEKRLARELLLLAGHGTPGGPRRMLPRISQEGLAEMVGTSRSRVNLYMNQFRRRGFIDYHDGMIAVHETLTRVVLDDAPVSDRDDGRTGPPEVRVESRPRPGRPSAGRVSNRLDVATLPETSPRRDMNRPHPLTSEINAPTVAPYWRVRTSAVSSRARILVVTRQAEIARALGAALQGCAYDVAQADSDALARLRGAPPDLIVTTEVRLLDTRDTPQHPLTAGPMPAILVVATGDGRGLRERAQAGR